MLVMRHGTSFLWVNRGAAHGIDTDSIAWGSREKMSLDT